jgi:hypothetical protein
VVPALASLGITLVAYGQNLVMEEVTLAAPMAAAPDAEAKPGEEGDAKGAQDAATGSVTAGNPEFGGTFGRQGPVERAPARIRSTPQEELVRRARENSGREDPFVSLVLPEAVVIQPVFIPTPPPSTRPSISAPRVMTRVNPITQRTERLVGGQWVEEVIQANPDEPRWTVQGILNTGREQLVILDLDGVAREAHIGEILEDGSKVVSISSNQVTLLSQGRRYVKTIEGSNLQ